MDRRDRYLGIIDYAAIILWVLESAELAAVALSDSSAIAAGVGVRVVGALGALALGVTGPASVAGITIGAVGAAVAGGVATDKGAGKDAPTAADKLGKDFYKIILKEEPFKSTTVRSVLRSYCWAPFLPVATDSSMLTALLLISKYRLKNVPIIEPGNPDMKNFITQSTVIQGLEGCKGRDWFDCIATRPISDLGLPFMSSGEVRIRYDGNYLRICIYPSLPFTFVFLNLARQLTVTDFMNNVVSTTPDSGSVMPPITCRMESTLGSVIHSLGSKSVHMIYVVADHKEDEVVGVITLREVISLASYMSPLTI
ncbi:hypothetical protein LWI28_018076 [Acer negundo]|uniref:CBS domain-containing protein n=1 Tax=Acer negundo TaxID=4023 RepID=A0AAD5IMY7_ACENE|nr:hypothetical protein LWI28_018076 [Acer negundo]KAK4841535.1 hypothetical protein QYF36_006006 [Acer negundo]